MNYLLFYFFTKIYIQHINLIFLRLAYDIHVKKFCILGMKCWTCLVPLCDLMFTKSNGLTKHLMKFHPEINSEYSEDKENNFRHFEEIIRVVPDNHCKQTAEVAINRPNDDDTSRIPNVEVDHKNISIKLNSSDSQKCQNIFPNEVFPSTIDKEIYIKEEPLDFFKISCDPPINILPQALIKFEQTDDHEVSEKTVKSLLSNTFSTQLFTCPKCSFKSALKSRFLRHRRRSECKSALMTRSSKRIKLDQELLSENCNLGNNFASDQSINAFALDDDDDEVIKITKVCDFCNKNFRDQDYFRVHLRNCSLKDLDENDAFQDIEQTDNSTYTDPFFKLSDVINTDEKNCDICGEKFKNHNMITKHTFIKHWYQIKDVKIYRCPHCNFATGYQPLLDYHSKISKNCWDAAELTKKFDITISCPFCPYKGMENRSELLNHLTGEHNGRSPYFCQKCPKLFSASLGLQKHVQKCHK